MVKVKSKIDSALLRRISGVQWAKYADWIREWTAGKRKMPRIVRLFGPENFKVRNNKIYLYDRELVFFEMTKRMMDDLDAELEKNIRQFLARFVR